MTPIQPVKVGDRRVANIFEAAFTSYVYPDGRSDGDAILQLDSELPLGIGSNCNRWMAYYGHHYYFDTFTGNYLVGGTQSSFASWTPTNVNIEPDYLKIWQILTLYN